MMEQKKYNPTGFIAFIFSTQMLLSWFSMQGIFIGDSTLFNGLYSLVCFPLYLIAAKAYAESGDHFSANLYNLFGGVFGGGLGVIYVAQFFDGRFGFGLEMNFVGTLTLLGAIVLLPLMLPSLYLPWTEFATWFLLDIWMFMMGIMGFVGESAGYTLYSISLPILLIVGALLMYMSVSELLKSCGMKGLPVGRPLMKFPEYPQ